MLRGIKIFLVWIALILFTGPLVIIIGPLIHYKIIKDNLLTGKISQNKNAHLEIFSNKEIEELVEEYISNL